MINFWKVVTDFNFWLGLQGIISISVRAFKLISKLEYISLSSINGNQLIWVYKWFHSNLFGNWSVDFRKKVYIGEMSCSNPSLGDFG